MAWQLVYTSAPELLETGRTGFGTVGKHGAIKASLQFELERISQFSRETGLRKDRIIYSHRVINLRDEQYHVISRIKDSGSDYTGRTNHIAHHIVFKSSEVDRTVCSPVDVIIWLNNNGIWRDRWDGASRIFEFSDEIQLNEITQSILLPANNWENIAKSAGNAAILAPGGKATEGCWIVYPQHESYLIISLIGEALCLHQAPWKVSFTTDTQPTDRIEEIQWRGVEIGSPLERTALQSVRPVLDLSNPSNLPEPVSEFISKAKTGLNTPPPPAAARISEILDNSRKTESKLVDEKKTIQQNLTSQQRTIASISALKSKAVRKEIIKKERISWTIRIVVGVLILIIFGVGFAYYEISKMVVKRNEAVRNCVRPIKNNSENVLRESIKKKYQTVHLEDSKISSLGSSIESVLSGIKTDQNDLVIILTGKDELKEKLQRIDKDLNEYSYNESSSIGLDEDSRKVQAVIRGFETEIRKELDDQHGQEAIAKAKEAARKRVEEDELAAQKTANDAAKLEEIKKGLESTVVQVPVKKQKNTIIFTQIQDPTELANKITAENAPTSFYSKPEKNIDLKELSSIQDKDIILPFWGFEKGVGRTKFIEGLKSNAIYTIALKNTSGDITFYIYYKDYDNIQHIPNRVFSVISTEPLKLEVSKEIVTLIKSTTNSILYSISKDDLVYSAASLEELEKKIQDSRDTLENQLKDLPTSDSQLKAHAVPVPESKEVADTKEMLFSVPKVLFNGLEAIPDKKKNNPVMTFTEWQKAKKTKATKLDLQYKEYLSITLKQIGNYLDSSNSEKENDFFNLHAAQKVDDEKTSLKQNFESIKNRIDPSQNGCIISSSNDKSKKANDQRYLDNLKSVFNDNTIKYIDSIFYPPTPLPTPVDKRMEMGKKIGKLDNFIRDLKNPTAQHLEMKITIQSGLESIITFVSP